MLLIFYLSSQAAEQSNQLSKGVTKIVVKTVERFPNAKFDANGLNHIIRKNAHFYAYLVLGGLVMNAVKRSGVSVSSLALSLLICVLYAISDEVHQLFVPGRGAQFTDVLIDCVGSMVGIWLYWIYNYIIKKGKLTTSHE